MFRAREFVLCLASDHDSTASGGSARWPKLLRVWLNPDCYVSANYSADRTPHGKSSMAAEQVEILSETLASAQIASSGVWPQMTADLVKVERRRQRLLQTQTNRGAA